MAVPILTDLSGGIREFSQVIMAHQSAVKMVEQTLLNLGGALAVLGSIAVVGALAGMVGGGGMLFLISAGLVGLSAALTGLEHVNWTKLGGDFSSAMLTIENSIGTFLYDLEHPSQWAKFLNASPGATAAPLPGVNRYGHQILPAPPQSAPQTSVADAAHAPVAAIASIQAWIDNHAPVTVVNPVAMSPDTLATIARHGGGDVHLDGAKVGKVIAKHVSGPRTGPTNGNLRNVGAGTAALALGGLY